MYTKTKIFDFKEDAEKVKPGVILISEPFSRDAYFSKSVVLITESNENGSVGFILNKPVTVPLSDLAKGFPKFNANISIGGPVETNSVHFIHTLGKQINKTLHITGNLYWGGDFQKLQQLASLGLLDQQSVKFFVGYSGWKPGQLKEEIENNYWKITTINEQAMISNNSHMWYNEVTKLGVAFKPWLNVPENPIWN